MIAAAGLLLIYLLRQLPELFRRMGGGQQKGRWVNDRSLGGKAVSRPHCPCAHHLIRVNVCMCASCVLLLRSGKTRSHRRQQHAI